jgi:hypothetical protein
VNVIFTYRRIKQKFLKVYLVCIIFTDISILPVTFEFTSSTDCIIAHMDAASFLKILSNADVEKKLNDIFRPVIELTVNELLKPIKQQLDTLV